MKTTLLNLIARSSRFRLRTMLILVAAAALPLAFFAVTESRRERFERLARYHEGQVQGWHEITLYGFRYMDLMHDDPRVFTKHEVCLDHWHLELCIKYRFAARHPWLPIGADLPRPE